VVPQVLEKVKDDVFVPVTAMLEIAIEAPLVLVKVTDCGLLWTPTARLPKERVVAESVVCAVAETVVNRQNIAARNRRTEL
jgi:hypothetical protein